MRKIYAVKTGVFPFRFLICSWTWRRAEQMTLKRGLFKMPGEKRRGRVWSNETKLCWCATRALKSLVPWVVQGLSHLIVHTEGRRDWSETGHQLETKWLSSVKSPQNEPTLKLTKLSYLQNQLWGWNVWELSRWGLGAALKMNRSCCAQADSCA